MNVSASKRFAKDIYYKSFILNRKKMLVSSVRLPIYHFYRFSSLGKVNWKKSLKKIVNFAKKKKFYEFLIKFEIYSQES